MVGNTQTETSSEVLCDGNEVIAICSGVPGLQHTLIDGRRSLTELFMHGDLVSNNATIHPLHWCRILEIFIDQILQSFLPPGLRIGVDIGLTHIVLDAFK